MNTKQEAELMEVYNAWWDSYLSGDVTTYDAYLDDDYRFIGSTNGEEFLDKKDTTAFFKATADQIAGKAALRNVIRTVEHLDDGLVLITDLADAWVIGEPEWVFYSRFRFSSLLRETKNGWRFIYQHFSAPDTKAQEGETLGTEQITKENQELRDAVRRRTTELQHKTRELEIEVALDRIRNRTLLMQDSSGLNEAAAVFFQQLQALNLLPAGARTYFCHIDAETAIAEVWMTHANGSVMQGSHQTPLNNSPSIGNYFEAWKRKEPIVVRKYTGKLLKEYLQFISSLPHVKADKDYQQLLGSPPAKIVMTDANFLQGNIGVMTLEPLSTEALDILTRFAKVFEFTYTRFLDLQKAEAQAREARIEAALEKARSRSMAMQSSDELPEVANVLFLEVQALGIPAWSCGYNILAEDKKWAKCCMSSEGTLQTPFTLRLWGEASFDEMGDFLRSEKTMLVQELGGKALEEHYAYMKSFPDMKPTFDQIDELGLSLPVYQINHLCRFTQGFLLFITYEKVPESHDIFKRFTRVFDQTYTRFLDLQKAEAQTREAQIEVAVERVRAKALSMHQSAHLHDVVVTLKKQLLGLNIPGVSAVTMYLEQDDGSIRGIDLSGMTDGEGDGSAFRMDKIFRLEDTDPDLWIRKIWNGKEKYFVVEADEADFDRIIKWLYTLDEKEAAIAEKIIKEEGIKKAWLPTVTLEKGKLSIDVLEPPTPEIESILVKVGAAFDLAYTRFLDLQKAEAQAREAKIEMALERVRSRSLAMHSSGELGEVVTVVLNNLLELGYLIDQGAAAHLAIFSEGTKDFFQWSADPALPHPVRSFIPYTDLPILAEFWDARQKGHDFFANVYSFEEKNTWFNFAFEHSDLKHIPGDLKKLLLESETYAHSIAIEKNSAIIINSITGNKLSENQIDTLRRFSKVFEQAYIRFMDLQKAEAQAREAQIELGLERVRARAMAMHKSEELSETSVVLFNELKKLNIQTTRSGFGIYDENIKAIQLWLTALSGPSAEIDVLGSIPFEAHYAIKDNYSAWKENKSFKVHTFSGKGVKEYYQKIGKYLSIAPQVKYPEKLVFSVFFFSEGSLNVMTDELLTEDEIKIMLRFANVFGLTYRRFLDLQKAEGQAREAEIELALERVRSRTMAMQRSEELVDVATVLFQQVKALGVPQWNCGFNIWNIGDNAFTYYPGSPDGIISPSPCRIPLTEHPVFMRFDESRKRGDELLIYKKEGEEQADHYRYMLSLPGVGDLLQSMLDAGFELPEFQIDHLANFAYGNLIFITYEHFPGMHDVFRRFAKVFEQTYTRFLDLQKAEAQTREAQINLAVERVRARALAMYKSDEILELVFKLKQEMMNLDIPNVVAATIHLKENDGTYTMWDLTAMEVSDGKLHQPMVVQYRLEELDPQLFIKRMWENTAPYFLVVQDEEDFKRTLQFLRDHGRTKEADETGAFLKIAGTKHAYHPAITLYNGRMCIDLLEPPADEIEMILTRMGAAFDLAYKRFEDLKNSEAQLREAQIERALEKVRSRTMGMQQSYELGDVATVLFNELNLLVDNLWTCGFVLCEKNREFDEWWLSTESGFIPAFNLPNTGDVTHANIYDAWKRGETYHTEQLEGQALQDHYDWLMNVPVSKKIFEEMRAAGFALPSWQKLHCAYFSYGYLVMITQVPCTGEQIFKRFAQVFDQTYTRFLDLQKAEVQALRAEQDLIAIKEARQKAEEAFTELQSTQKQLIQSEKMASLGELTAGIAHEIQNPLNFVNNFSEVSKEMLDEMRAAIEKGNTEEAHEIMNDVIQNLEKINHHGKRADAIVKGMLQHSQSSSGQKELTDINALADEYLRLAYHGLRAKDKSFNAKLETDFDPSVGMINVVTQDIGRVILNLITNAFYAAPLPSRQAGTGSARGFSDPDYKHTPTVSITTKRVGDKVLISVRDNGPGIPQKILDKIFQPFFTTKPTGQGTGLGLSLSYDIVKAHGGEITVETKEGEGTAFIINLPIH